MAERQRQDGGMRGEGASHGLARQLAALRVGVEGIRDDVDEVGDPPDYREDLRATRTTLDAVAGLLAAFKASPALSRTPEDYARLINEAADKVAARPREAAAGPGEAAATPGEEVAEAAKALKDAAAALDRTVRFQAYWDFLGKVVLLVAVALPFTFIAGVLLRHFLG